ncbi:Hypothetical_protein [Hexamita inflata]|uniref:Hypothetical_protein n=1 Tax=Hexamita inflata TaxID=28002 RepID=A0AA86ULE3_9EUKA|nr:Hypothetical protein HINF_LOCUS47729 [Hexamita inflata]
MVLTESDFRNNQLCEVQQRVQLAPQSEQARFRYATIVLLFNYYGKLMVIQKLQCKLIYFKCHFRILDFCAQIHPFSLRQNSHSQWEVGILQFFISWCGIESKRNKSIPSLGRNKTFKSKILVNKENFPDEESLKTPEPWSSNNK